MKKLLVKYSTSYFCEINEHICYVGDSLLLECEDSADIETIDDWFRNTYYKSNELKYLTLSIKDVTEIYEEFINTIEINKKYDDLLRQLNGKKRYITIKKDNK